MRARRVGGHTLQAMSDGSEPPPAGWYANPGGQRQWWDGSRWTDVYEDTSPSMVAQVETETPAEPGANGNATEPPSRRWLWAFAFAPLAVVAFQAALFQGDVSPDSNLWRIVVPASAVVLLWLLAFVDFAQLPRLTSDKSWGVIWGFLFPGYPAWRARATSTSYAPFAAWCIVLALSATASGLLIVSAEERLAAAAVESTRADPFDEAQEDPDAIRSSCGYKMARARTRFNIEATRYEERVARE
ncbi:MAG: DUF2510 domain-containing protein, partial [Gammaproteobacteria bacterium]